MTGPLRVLPVPCLRDNYAYLVFRADGDGDCFVVDPSASEPVLDALEKHGLRLRAIFNTHHHRDHVDGNLELRSRFAAEIYGNAADHARIPGLTCGLSHRESFLLLGIPFFVLHVPGHTLGALALCSGDQTICFTGDTLFCGGCGRLFEGSPGQMLDSLTRVLGELPDHCQIYAGHEYTERNLEFATTLLHDPAVLHRLADVRAARAGGQFAASATLGLERATNPFLRCGHQSLQALFGTTGSEVDTFAALRAAKDSA